MPGGKGKQCWATIAVKPEQVVHALVLSKSLRNSMTSRPALIVISHLIAKEFEALLQKEFDWVIKLDDVWTYADNLDGFLFAKLSLWGFVQWEQIAFLSPNTMVVRNCDEIFKSQEGRLYTKSLHETEVMILKPCDQIWSSLKSVMLNGKGACQEKDLLMKILDPQDIMALDEIYNLSIKLDDGLLTRNLKEIGIASFTTVDPMKLISQGGKVNGILETALLKMWNDFLTNGVLQSIQQMHGNRLKHSSATLLNLLHGLELQSKPILSPTVSEELNNAVAVIGVACRFPGANNLDELWSLLLEGRNEISHHPEGRWTRDKFPNIHPQAKNSMGGFLKCPLEDFDGKFFNITPKELVLMDPQQRLTLQVAWEALEDAGIDPISLHGSHTGVFGGAWTQDYRDGLEAIGLGESEFLRTYLCNTLGTITGRISHCLGLTGPSISSESGCSTSMVAVDMACKSLRNFQTDLSLACGVNLLIKPYSVNKMIMALSPDWKCKTFDADANGFVRAEGVGVLVLKRYADAVRDGDRVWSLIRGSAIVQEGPSGSLGTPTVKGESLAMSLALEESGVSPLDVSLVEAHGTGTVVGDPIEVAAIASVYSHSKRSSPLVIGSVKTNIGHTESCAGIAGIIKVILSLHNEIIPPHKNFSKLNPAIDLDAIPAMIPLEPMNWPRQEGFPRVAGISSFGLTGTDAHLILQEPPTSSTIRLSIPEMEMRLSNYSSKCILALSAKTNNALEDKIKQWHDFLENLPSNISFEDACYSANIGRSHFSRRIFAHGSNPQELLKELKKSQQLSQISISKSPTVCFLFPGQGSQYVGMAKGLYESELCFQMNFDFCDQVLKKEYDIYLKDVIWGDKGDYLSLSIYSQTAIFVIEVCLFKLWESWGVKPSFVLGHSFGENAAAVAAGIISLEDGLRFVAERSILCSSLPEGRMLVLKESQLNTQQLIDSFIRLKGTGSWLDIAAVNSSEQSVVAGETSTVENFQEFCKENGIKCTMLNSLYAFHSRLLDPILGKLKRTAQKISFLSSPESCRFISGADGVELNELSPDYLVHQTRDKVEYSKAIRCALEMGCELFLELGPQPVLSAITMVNAGDLGMDNVKCYPSLRKQDDECICIITSLGHLYSQGINVDWNGFYQWQSMKKVTVPFYPFQNNSHWFQVPNDGGVLPIHPLLGKPFSSPLFLNIYTQKLSLQLEENAYLKHHVIGNHVVFPAAGYLEMCIAAGHDYSQNNQIGRSFFLENFTIQTPLIMGSGYDAAVSRLQTVISSENSQETRISIYSKSDDNTWIQHAFCNFQPNKFLAKEVSKNPPSFNYLREKINTNLYTDNQKIYSELYKVGLKYGDTFQTLRKGWSTDTKDEFLWEIQISADCSSYIVHPVASDAMIQALLLSTSFQTKAKLHVPVSAKKYVVHNPSNNMSNGKHFVHCLPNDMTAYLYSEDGTLIAQMIDVLLVETTVAALVSASDSRKTSSPPPMYEQIWTKKKITDDETTSLNVNLSSKNLWIVFGKHDCNITVKTQKYLSTAGKRTLIVVPESSQQQGKHMMTAFTFRWRMSKNFQN